MPLQLGSAEREQKALKLRVNKSLAEATERVTAVHQETPKSHRNTQRKRAERRQKKRKSRNMKEHRCPARETKLDDALIVEANDKRSNTALGE